MDENIKKHVLAYCEKKGYEGTEDSDVIETILECGNQVYRDEGDDHRHWTEYTFVVELDGMLIGYNDARSSGDMSASEKGYEFEPSSIHECKAEKVTKTIYVRK